VTHSFLSPCISLAITGIGGGGIWETKFGNSFVERKHSKQPINWKFNKARDCAGLGGPIQH